MARGGSRFHVDGGCLIWRSWDSDEHVVYHRPSGETHVLNAVAAATLRNLETSDLSLDELCERIASEFEAGSPAEYRTSLVNLLEYFDELGLIQPVRRS